MVETSPALARDATHVAGARERHRAPRPGAALVVGALGVVFGDIGTSPLYALQTVFTLDGGQVKPTVADVLGVAALILYSLLLVVTIKYVTVVMRADNFGEGGVLALASLVNRTLATHGRRVGAVLVLGAIGAALFYGDSLITPAISVLSAVEGLSVASAGFSQYEVPISAAILLLLFAGQRFGTSRVGALFGPVMLVWFAVIGITGLPEIIREPGILRGLSPTYALSFLGRHPVTAFIAMGAVVLAITGAEALYADMGHFGAGPIRRAWLVVVFPALVLNYLGQAALVLHHPAAVSNPFYLLVPHALLLPMVALSTVATVIASQAVISGAFSATRQAMQLGFLPPVQVRQTSEHEGGQIYVPAVNGVLLVGVLSLVVTFASSSKLAAAYGIAVTGTFLITTALILTYAHVCWRWQWWQTGLAAVVIGALELVYFAANMTKIDKGGWLPLLIALLVFTVMATWRRGRTIVTDHRTAQEGSLREFVAAKHDVARVPGLAVFLHPDDRTTPLALRANVEANHVLHERVVIVSARAENVPHIADHERLVVEHLGAPEDRTLHVLARYGFADHVDVPAALRLLCSRDDVGFDVDPDHAVYFVSRAQLKEGAEHDMARWRKRLFLALAKTAANPSIVFGLPVERTVLMGTSVEV